MKLIVAAVQSREIPRGGLYVFIGPFISWVDVATSIRDSGLEEGVADDRVPMLVIFNSLVTS